MDKKENMYFVGFMFLALFLTPELASGGGSEKIGVYELRRGFFAAKFTNYGASMLSMILPDKDGKLADVVLGFESLDAYKTDDTYFGAIVGRVANRIGNAQFSLNGTVYKLIPNDGKNFLHGGKTGYSDVIWKVKSYRRDSHITFTYNSPDGQQGFPGKLSISVTYMLIDTNKLGVRMVATPVDKATPVNLALHTYWNLAGHDSGTIMNHTLQLLGSEITPVDDELIPTGAITPVKGTPYDFLQPHQIGSMFGQLKGGYDINYVLDGPTSEHLRKAAVLQESGSGRKMELWTNQAGVQFYSGNMLKHVEGGKAGAVYGQYAGLCLETQGFPDSVNHPNFPSQIVSPGETYEHFMLFRFTAS